jgi:exodeoxyribonuclease V alpha subunit
MKLSQKHEEKQELESELPFGAADAMIGMEGITPYDFMEDSRI